MKVNICPRCGENQIKATITPERKVKIAPKTNHLVVGDKRYYECLFCHWWSEATWNGHVWQWTTIRMLRPHEREMLDLRLKRIKKKRRAFGGKGK